MSARAAILEQIRQSLKASGEDTARRQRAGARLEAHPRHTIPERGQLDPEGRIGLLTQILEGQSASIARLEDIRQAPREIARYLSGLDIEPALRIGENEALDALDWAGAGVEITRGAADAYTLSACSTAFCAIAESGTLMLLSGPQNPVTLDFLPDNHIIILNAGDVLASYEEGWDKMRAANMPLPRTVNYISGPSRTADIEQTIFLGAHGPRRLHVIITG
jgi:L-lactate dehydrogenase complex protein LldG